MYAARPGGIPFRTEIVESKLVMRLCLGRRSQPVRGSPDHPDYNVGQVQQIIHFMAGDENGAPMARELANPLSDALSVSRTHFGERLISDQAGGPSKQRQAHFDPPTFAARHLLRRLPSQRFDVEPGNGSEIEGMAD